MNLQQPGHCVENQPEVIFFPDYFPGLAPIYRATAEPVFPMVIFIIAAIIFVGTHLFLAQVCRTRLVASLGEPGYRALFSFVAAIAAAALVWAYLRAPATASYWNVSAAGHWLAVAATLLAAVLLAGSFIGNPLLAYSPGRDKVDAQIRGVFVLTRHPMMWAIALLAAAHFCLIPTPKNLVLCGTLGFLALAGAALQERRTARGASDDTVRWRERTSYVPFASVLAGRTRVARIGWQAPAAGAVLWLLASGVHRLALAG